MDRIGGVVMHPLLWSTLAKTKTGMSSDNTTLLAPDAVCDRPTFVTTAAPLTGSPQSTTAFITDWSDLLFGVRQDLQVRILNEAFMASNLQIAALV